MARLKNVKSGAIVSVDDSKVERMGSDWAPVEAPAKSAPKPQSKSSK